MSALRHPYCDDLNGEDRRFEVVRIFAVAVVRCLNLNQRCSAQVRSKNCSTSREMRHMPQSSVPVRVGSLKTQA